MDFIEIWKNVPVKLILKNKGGIYTAYHFVDSNNLRVEMSSKKRRQQKKCALKQRIEVLLYTCIEVSVFLFFFCRQKEQLLILLFSLLVNVSIGGENFESCSAWEGANGLPWGRKDCRSGDWRSEKLYRYLENELHHVSKNAALPQVFFFHILRTVPKDF